MCADKNKSHKLITIIICCCKMLSCSHFSPNVFRLSRICAMSDAVLKLCYGNNRDLKTAVYGKQLTSRNSFVIKSKSSTVKYSSNTIYYKNLKCCTKTPCMTTETLSLMGNSLGHPLLDVRVDVRRFVVSGCDLVWLFNCKMQTSNDTSQTSS